MPTRLSGLGASFLYLETRTAHMHVASALVLDPSTAPGGAITFDGFKDYIADRLHVAPHFRRRVVPVPLRLDHPVWIEDPYRPGLPRAACARLALRPWQALGATRRVLASASGLVKFGLAEKAASPPSPFTAPMTTLNGAIGPHRRIAFAEVSLSEVKQVKNALGGTVNDVVIAMVAGALRRFLEHRGEAVDRPLVAMVPISTHAGAGGGGNQVSAMLTEVPVDEPDPVARVRRVSAGTKGAKEQHGAVGADTIQQLAELTPAGVASLAARLYTRTQGADRHRPIWNLVVSNVPGPRFRLYAGGARVEALYPVGPVHEMSGLNVTLFSYEDTIFVGINADRDMVPDVAVFGQAVCDAADELAKAAAEHA